jgi:leader peptidase (prepilin peptidase)/N-methyltransferase
MLTALHALLIPLCFLAGSAVGSFLNVCIYRIPWQKSLLWPDSRCPGCFQPIAARDNLPILGWIVLGGRCRHCRMPISVRYPLIEGLVGLLFVVVYLVDVYAQPELLYGDRILGALVRMGYHQVLVALLIVATFIDYDLTIIPDEVTVTGMILGLALGTLVPTIRLEPGTATTAWQGLQVGVVGLIAGGGLVWVVRFLGSRAFGREAMGFGDVTLLAMIGSFLGWQAAVLTFFLAPFFGLAHALMKVGLWLRKWLLGRPRSGADREMPFGPYLSMAALALLLSWRWMWEAWGRSFFETVSVVCLYLIGRDS